MEDPNKQHTQSRFLIAAVLSMLVLTGWGYFIAPDKPVDENANIAQANSNANTQTNKEASENKTEEEPESTDESEPEIEEAPNKTVTIKTPLYEVKLDSKGAVATSWVLVMNDSPDVNDELERRDLFARDSSHEDRKPLQLISQKAVEENEVPFRLSTGDQKLDGLVNTKNYSVSVDDESVELKGSETKEIEFTLTGGDGVEVKKTFVFRADSYVSDLSVKLTKGGQPVQNIKLLIGASIGDQGIEIYDFYKVEPEGVSFVEDDVDRQYAASITEDNGKGDVSVNGSVDWAGISDTYFAMIAIPANKAAGLEFKSTKYEQEVAPFHNGIIATITRDESTTTKKHLMTAYVPITADGSKNQIYTGTKDYFVLDKYNAKLSETAGRTINIGELINYGWVRFFTKPLAYPILSTLKFLNKFTGNYGISIIIFTFFFYSLLFPLRWFSSKSFKKAQKNAPKMKELQDKLKAMQKKGIPMDDPEMRKLQMDQLKMTKDALPIGGCLPMLLQFPLLIALYYTVSIALGFRHAEFLWFSDLSAADYLHILPIAFAISMVLTFKFTPMAPAVTPEQKMQQKMMAYIMPIMMLWIMWSAPAGLLLYWFTGNIIMFGQQMLINWLNKDDTEAVPEPAK